MTPYIKSQSQAIQLLNFSASDREMGRKNISKVIFVGEICIKNIVGVDIMFSKRHFFFQKSLVKWYKLTFAVQISPMSTRREISLA